MASEAAKVYLALALSVSLAAQVPSRDAGTAVPTGTAVISGRVVTEEATPRPLRRTIVTISGDLPQTRSAITDDDGRFTFSNLPAGRFTITTKKAAYVPGAYGATRPGTALSLSVGQQANVIVKMSRGAVVTGVVRDQNGESLPGVPVGALRVPGSGIIDNLFSGSQVGTTDDRGGYRFFGLPSGEYIVAAAPRLPGSGDLTGWPVADLDAVLKGLGQNSGRGVGCAAAPEPVDAHRAADAAVIQLCADLLPRQRGLRGRAGWLLHVLRRTGTSSSATYRPAPTCSPR